MTRSTAVVSMAGAVAVTLALAAGASAQTWDYKATRKAGRGQASGEVVHATVTLEQRDGKEWFRMVGGPDTACLRSEWPASVTRTDLTTTIEPQIGVAGCEPFRLVIRNDGSGGDREIRKGDEWKPARSDHGLTPVK